jgi:uncharacterized protein involved in exopolysaccharide biosynthesis
VSFRDLALSLRRQWLSVLLGLALTAGACYAVLGAVPPTYRAMASVVLVPSHQTSEREVNPFLDLGSANAMRDVVARSVMADTVSALLLDGTVNTSYDVYSDATVAPIVVAVAAGPTQDQTLRTLGVVLEQIDRSLVEVQDGQGVPEAVRVVSQRLSVDSVADQMRSSTLRAVVATATLGGAATLLGAFWIDAWRRRKRHVRGGDGDVEEATAERKTLPLDPRDREQPVQEPPQHDLSPPPGHDEVREGPPVPRHVSAR